MGIVGREGDADDDAAMTGHRHQSPATVRIDDGRGLARAGQCSYGRAQSLRD